MHSAIKYDIIFSNGLSEEMGATLKNKGERNMIDKLIAKIQKTGAPIVVGLDPMLSYIPDQAKAFSFT